MFSKEKIDFPDHRKKISWQINSPKICGFRYRPWCVPGWSFEIIDWSSHQSWKNRKSQNRTSRMYSFWELRRTPRTVLFNVNTGFTCLVKKKHGIRIIEKVCHGELTHWTFSESRFGRDCILRIRDQPLILLILLKSKEKMEISKSRILDVRSHTVP